MSTATAEVDAATTIDSRASTRGAGHPRAADSSSNTGTPKTWSMWPCE